MDRYVRYTYWLKPAKLNDALIHLLEVHGVRVKPARSVMCTPLDPFSQAAYISPEVWDRICARQGSWYRQSQWSGHALLVVAFPVEVLRAHLNTLIRPTDFAPGSLASLAEMKQLVQSEAYLSQRPEEWEQVSRSERERWAGWLEKLGIEDSFEKIFLAHRANHANFLDPLLYVRANGAVIPYSIAPSHHLCSCCLEMYNLIGASFPKKFVVPCLGALTFAGLPQDRYFEVTTSATRLEVMGKR
jgi:hypothetical protein